MPCVSAVLPAPSGPLEHDRSPGAQHGGQAGAPKARVSSTVGRASIAVIARRRSIRSIERAGDRLGALHQGDVPGVGTTTRSRLRQRGGDLLAVRERRQQVVIAAQHQHRRPAPSTGSAASLSWPTIAG